MKTNFAISALLVITTLVAAPTTQAASDADFLIKKGTLILDDNYNAAAQRDKYNTNDDRAKRTAPKTDRDFQSQAKLTDGILKITRTAGSDHSASVQREVTFTDAVIALRYRTTGKNNFSFNFNDRADKTVHAGHLFKVQIDPTAVIIQDQKTGSMALAYQELRDKGKAGDAKAKKAGAEMLKGKTVTHKHKSSPDQWHDLKIIVKGNTVVIEIDGHRVGNHHSPGLGTLKTMLAYSVKDEAEFDSLQVYKLK